MWSADCGFENCVDFRLFSPLLTTENSGPKGKILRSSVTGTLTRTLVTTPGRKVGEKEQSWHR